MTAHFPIRRDAKLDLLRVIAILACIVSHALMGQVTERTPYYWITMFFPDTAGIFFMSSGAIILNRASQCGWRYVWHRVWTFLPEFIIFSIIYAVMDYYWGFQFEDTTLTRRLIFMLITPTWGPGWFILALISLYLVLPLMSAWTLKATKRQIEIGIGIWLVATLMPFFTSQTDIDVPGNTFSTLFNYAGYMLIGYYLVHWPLKSRSNLFKILYFAVTVLIGVVFGYFLGRSGEKWDYMDKIVSGVSLNIVMLSVLVFGIVLLLPSRWFEGSFARIVSWLSSLSLGIYCCHWLIVRYWAIENQIDCLTATAVTLAVSIPVAYLMKKIREGLRLLI